MCKTCVDRGRSAQHSPSKRCRLRFGAALALQFLLFASGCIGGQTTVPASFTGQLPPCSASDERQQLAAAFSGTRVLDVAWEHSERGAEVTRGSTQLTLDLSAVVADTTRFECRKQRVSVELTTADGELRFSGNGWLYGTPQAATLQLEGTSRVLAADLQLSGDAVEGSVEFEDGSMLSLRHPVAMSP
jgi:hypothetical protein